MSSSKWDTLYCVKQLKCTCNLIFRLCCYHYTAFWCDYITWISSALSKWTRLYLENSTDNWQINSIQFSTFWCTSRQLPLVCDRSLVRYFFFWHFFQRLIIIVQMKLFWLQVWFIENLWRGFNYITHTWTSILWRFPATQWILFKQPTLLSFSF